MDNADAYAAVAVAAVAVAAVSAAVGEAVALVGTDVAAVQSPGRP